jgi:hypothetical protein
LSGDRARSQRSDTRFPYTTMKMELDHEKLDVYFGEIVYEYVNDNENDYATTQAKLEQSLSRRAQTGMSVLQSAVPKYYLLHTVH